MQVEMFVSALRCTTSNGEETVTATLVNRDIHDTHTADGDTPDAPRPYHFLQLDNLSAVDRARFAIGKKFTVTVASKPK